MTIPKRDRKSATYFVRTLAIGLTILFILMALSGCEDTKRPNVRVVFTPPEVEEEEKASEAEQTLEEIEQILKERRTEEERKEEDFIFWFL